MLISQFHFYSLGIVAVNKPLDTDVVEVTPVEKLTMLDGEINDHEKQVELQSKMHDGSAYNTKTIQTATIKCRWLPMGSNRITSPDVRRGEQVAIYRFGDSDKYFWASLEYEKRLRKLETVLIGISATKEESDIGKPDSMYYMEFSTHRKLIHMHTSKKNGEPFAYDVQLNTGEGYLLITDDVGNLINLDSKNTYIEITNADGSTIHLDKRDIKMSAPGHMYFEAQSFNINSSTYIQNNLNINGYTKTNGIGTNSAIVSPGLSLGSQSAEPLIINQM